MPLTCECSGDYGDWSYVPPNDYAVFTGRRRKRCCSCNELIDINAICAEFERIWTDEWEDDKRLAPWNMCERCADLYFSLEALGFCVDLGEDMRELVREYAETYGPGAELG